MPARLPEPDLKAAFTDHDRLFKELLTVFFIDFLDLFLPELREDIDVETLSFLGTEIFTDVTVGQRHIVDILAKAKMRNQETFLLVHVENQNRSQAEFPRRMFHYFARLEEKYSFPVYPVAIFSFKRPLNPEPDQFRVAFRSFTALEFHFHAIQLNQLRWQDFVQKRNPVAAALMSRMNIAPKDRPRVKLECLRLLATLRLDPARMQLISGFVDTYLQLSEPEIQVFERELAALPQEDREATMPLTISWKEAGRVEGRVEGLVEGRAEGESQMLLQIGEHRLGKPSREITERIRAIKSPARLLELAGRLLTVESWDELLSPDSAE